jgi:hypothetical protein
MFFKVTHYWIFSWSLLTFLSLGMAEDTSPIQTEGLSLKLPNLDESKDLLQTHKKDQKSGDNLTKYGRREPIYQFTYLDREHTWQEDINNIGFIYAASWVTYFLSQPVTFLEEGSFEKYADNFGELVFDNDEPFWNWIVHPYSGSQLYLFYRADGYSQIDSIKMAFISSSLFEFFVEIYTEPASYQDLYQTPVLGSILGITFEKVSLYLLNTGHPAAQFFGYLLNPYPLLWFYDGKIKIIPQTNYVDQHSLNLVWSF